MRLGAIFDDRQTVFNGDTIDCIHFARPTGEVNGDDRACSRGHGRFERLCGHVLAHGVDIGEDGPGATDNAGTGRSNITAAGDKDIIAGTDLESGRVRLRGQAYRWRRQRRSDSPPSRQTPARTCVSLRRSSS